MIDVPERGAPMMKIGRGRFIPVASVHRAVVSFTMMLSP